MQEQQQDGEKPIDDETLWGVPGTEAQQGTDAFLPEQIDEAEKEADITEQAQRETE